jgi:hypothetical protein
MKIKKVQNENSKKKKYKQKVLQNKIGESIINFFGS